MAHLFFYKKIRAFSLKEIVFDKTAVEKILIIKLRGIGDVVLSTIVLDNLKEEFPNAKIDYLVEAPSLPGLIDLPQINNLLLFDRKSFIKRAKIIYSIRKNKYDLILDFFTNPSTAIMTFLSGTKFRVGFPYRGRTYAYNLFGPIDREKYHAAELHLETLKLLGIQTGKKQLHFSINAKTLYFAEKYFMENFSSSDFVVGICPTGGWHSKKCDAEKFAEIGEAIIQKYDAKILILWGKSDKEDALKIHTLMQKKSFLAPDTTIQELAAMISRCKLLIANDSGPMHISTAIGTPVLSLHGPTNPLLQGPYGEKHEWIQLSSLDCIECNLLDCPRNHECFMMLPVSEILNKVDKLISKNSIIIKPKYV